MTSLDRKINKEKVVDCPEVLMAVHETPHLTKAMADAFGVSPEFIDRETAQFIASGQIACKIDKVNGIIESAVPDSRNESYVQVIKQGDVLLARMQALSKVIDM